MFRTIWFIMLASGAILFTLSIILFFIFNVPELIDELSGRKARRQIKRLKKLNGTSDITSINTGEVYSAMSSGSLLSRELNALENGDLKEIPKKPVVKDVHSKVVSSDEERPTTLLEENQETNYMEEEGKTSYMDDSSATYCIRLLEEQTSIGG